MVADRSDSPVKKFKMVLLDQYSTHQKEIFKMVLLDQYSTHQKEISNDISCKFVRHCVFYFWNMLNCKVEEEFLRSLNFLQVRRKSWSFRQCRHHFHS
ncbi:hypothetical protein YC2023_015933 [Brassica napus]